MSNPPTAPVEYRIDGSDRLIWKNPAWDKFAEENGFQRAVLNTVIWDHVTDRATAHLYRVMVDEARRSGKHVTLPFRCDSPLQQRRMTLRISPLEGRHVQFSAYTDSIREHGPVRLIDASVPRSTDVLLMCSWCKRVLLHEWMDLELATQHARLFEAASMPSISHGICDTCSATIEAGLD